DIAEAKLSRLCPDIRIHHPGLGVYALVRCRASDNTTTVIQEENIDQQVTVMWAQAIMHSKTAANGSPSEVLIVVELTRPVLQALYMVGMSAHIMSTMTQFHIAASSIECK